jgi:hypothetical protein
MRGDAATLRGTARRVRSHVMFARVHSLLLSSFAAGMASLEVLLERERHGGTGILLQKENAHPGLGLGIRARCCAKLLEMTVAIGYKESEESLRRCILEYIDVLLSIRDTDFLHSMDPFHRADARNRLEATRDALRRLRKVVEHPWKEKVSIPSDLGEGVLNDARGDTVRLTVWVCLV